MSLNSLTYEELKERYKLLAKASQSESNIDINLQTELANLEKLIKQDFVALTRKGCPDNITDILQELNNELVRFRAFCEFPDLATKSIVGIGGGFSAGKSSFINKLIGQKRLVVEVDPTTSMPAYVMKGEKESIQAINMRNRAISLTQEQFSSLTHEERHLYESQVGGLLQSAFLSLPDFNWDNLAILDTPGYSKPEDNSWNERTDENLARSQLNSSDYIIWVVPADIGTISNDDIQFLGSLNTDIPKLVVLSKADKKESGDIDKIIDLIRSTLMNRGIQVLDVVPYSRQRRANYPLDSIYSYLDNWNKIPNALHFAQNFKRQFLAYQRFVEDEQRQANVRIHKLNRIITMSEEGEVVNDASFLLHRVKSELDILNDLVNDISKLNQIFFIKLKEIGDLAGVPLPEPNALELMEIDKIDLLGMLRQVRQNSGIEEPMINPFDSILNAGIDLSVINKILRRDTVPNLNLEGFYNSKVLNDIPSKLLELKSIDSVIDTFGK